LVRYIHRCRFGNLSGGHRSRNCRTPLFSMVTLVTLCLGPHDGHLILISSNTAPLSSEFERLPWACLIEQIHREQSQSSHFQFFYRNRLPISGVSSERTVAAFAVFFRLTYSRTFRLQKTFLFIFFISLTSHSHIAVLIVNMDGFSAAAPATAFNSINNTTTSGYETRRPHSEYFRSRRVKAEDVERPWLEEKHPRQFWVKCFPLVGLVLGLTVTGVLIWDGVRTVARHNYCEVLNDNFTSWNSDVWSKEVEVGGFGYVSVGRVPFGC
jgi:hypothetical protein